MLSAMYPSNAGGVRQSRAGRLHGIVLATSAGKRACQAVGGVEPGTDQLAHLYDYVLLAHLSRLPSSHLPAELIKIAEVQQ